MTSTLYAARPVNRRRRATQAEMAERSEMLVKLAHEHGPCSVRHLFYASVVAGVPGITKDDKGYGKVQRLVLDLRRQKRIPYRLVVDNTRWMRKARSYESVADALAVTASMYRRNLWSSSPCRVEVWAESDSIAGTIHEITELWDVPLMVTRGQSSETFAYSAAEAWAATTQRPVVLYVGDHDPAGLDIEEALHNKLTTFYVEMLAAEFHGHPVDIGDPDDLITWSRVGVTWEQVEALNLPGTPPKLKGRRKPYPFPLSVEAEALPANLLRDLLQEEISSLVNHRALAVIEAAEESEREILHALAGEVIR